MTTPRGSGRSADVRAALDHPVVDADGHLIETAPVFHAYLRDQIGEIGGGDVLRRFEAAGGIDYDEMVLRPWDRLSWEERRRLWATRPPWWSLPARNTLDRATAHLPRLLHERLDELGIDFAVLYPSRALTTTAIKDPEVRVAACRALNRFNQELYAPFAERLTVVAQIPMHTPAEALDELEHAVAGLGMKAIMINGLVHRPIGEPAEARPGAPNWGSGSGERIDSLGLDSAHDYDPVWRRCLELGVSPASHTPGMGWGSRRSVSSYVYNHIGSFGASMEALCKSLFLGGVTRRFPALRFGLLEGGVAWACSLYADLMGHWEKRNREAIRHLDPAQLDYGLLLQLVKAYGDERFTRDLPAVESFFRRLEPEPPFVDEWQACGVESPEELRDRFVPSFYFGCEADDPMVALAFDGRLLPLGAKLQAMFSSDIGHWDVPDMSEVLAEAFELVEKGLVCEADFRDFVFTHPVRFYTAANPDFFRGTRVEEAAAAVVAGKR